MWPRRAGVAMRRSDLVLAILVVLALVATAAAALRGDSWTDERTLHQRFASYRLTHDLAGSEWFRYEGDLRDYVLSLTKEAKP